MKRAATTLALSLIVSMIVVACASMSGGGRDLVARGVQAQGGPEALAAVKTISQKATVRYWEPEQSAVAGGEMPFANESALEMVTDVSARSTRMDWVRKLEYPAPRTFTFSEIVTAEAGYVAGIDSAGRNKQSQESNPPAHSMSGLRLAASPARAAPHLAPPAARDVQEPRPGRPARPTSRWAAFAIPAVAYQRERAAAAAGRVRSRHRLARAGPDAGLRQHLGRRELRPRAGRLAGGRGREDRALAQVRAERAHRGRRPGHRARGQRPGRRGPAGDPGRVPRGRGGAGHPQRALPVGAAAAVHRPLPRLGRRRASTGAPPAACGWWSWAPASSTWWAARTTAWSWR